MIYDLHRYFTDWTWCRGAAGGGVSRTDCQPPRDTLKPTDVAPVKNTKKGVNLIFGNEKWSVKIFFLFHFFELVQLRKELLKS